MATTTDRAAGDRRLLVEALINTLRDSRASLPHGLNGRGPAPSDRRVAQLRKDILAGKSALIESIVALVATDIVDGVESRKATEWLQQIIDFADMLAMTHPIGANRPIIALVMSEEEAEHRANRSTFPLVDTKGESPKALHEALEAHETHRAKIGALINGIRHRIALSRNEEGRGPEGRTPSLLRSAVRPTSVAHRKDSHIRPLGASAVVTT